MRRARADTLRPWAPDAAAVVTVLVLTAPLWRWGGGGLARDLVFTPRHPWNLDAVGLGTSLPRAVPLDAVLAALTSVLDGAVVFRVCVVGVLLLAGCGAHRMAAHLPLAVRMLVAVVAVWNPFVVERLALGQWALLSSYAALWWLLPALRRVLDGPPGGGGRLLAPLLGWCWLGSLTPTGGALVVLLVLGTCAAVHPPGRRALAPVAVAVLGQLPWLLPAVLGVAGAISDPGGVAAFGSRAERPGGPLATLVATGGVWSPFVVPPTSATLFAHLLTLVVVLSLVAGGRQVWRHEPGLVVVAGAGFVLAALVHLPGGQETLVWAVRHVPGAGLLRDGQKWLLPYTALVVLTAGEAGATLLGVVRRRDRDLAAVLAGVLVVVPVGLLPDAAARTWETLRPVDYPRALARVVARLDRADPATGAAVTLPWTSYREFSWGNPLSAADPLPRWTRHEVVVSDALRTPTGTLAGEDPRTREVSRVLEGAGSGRLGPGLAGAGVGWVVVYRDQPGAESLDLAGLEAVDAGPELALYRVGEPMREVPPARSTGARILVLTADGLWALAFLVALSVAGARLVPTRPRKPVRHRA